VKTPEAVADRGTDMDAQRGATTALPHEVANNMPLLQARLDARALPAYAEQWCAQVCLGSDGEPTTKGMPRFRQLGGFKQVADAWQWGRRIQRGASDGTAVASVLWEQHPVLQRQ